MEANHWQHRLIFGSAAKLARRLAVVALGMAGSFGPAAQAIQLADGTVYFAQPPRLLKASTTFNSARAWGATYYFTLQVPSNAGEPLQRLMIQQRQGPDTVQFDLDDTRAFEADNRDQKFTLGEIERDRKERSVTLAFDPPIPPGKTVTVGLRPHYNPAVGGVYLFGVTAFPAGEKSHGQFLGFGRLHFYDRYDSFFPFRSWWYRPKPYDPWYRYRRPSLFDRY